MFGLVFSKNDLDKALLMGAILINEQKTNKGIAYLIKINNNINFEKSGINCIKTNNINF